jgi:hypothetical protein
VPRDAATFFSSTTGIAASPAGIALMARLPRSPAAAHVITTGSPAFTSRFSAHSVRENERSTTLNAASDLAAVPVSGVTRIL